MRLSGHTRGASVLEKSLWAHLSPRLGAPHHPSNRFEIHSTTTGHSGTLQSWLRRPKIFLEPRISCRMRIYPLYIRIRFPGRRQAALRDQGHIMTLHRHLFTSIHSPLHHPSHDRVLHKRPLAEHGHLRCPCPKQPLSRPTKQPLTQRLLASIMYSTWRGLLWEAEPPHTRELSHTGEGGLVKEERERGR